MSWFPKNTVLVPFDFSDESLRAVAVGLELAKEPDGVHVLHVMAEHSPAEPVLLWQAYESGLRRKHASELIREKLADPKFQNVKIDVVIGNPGEEIAKFAKLWRIDMIVMPSHGRSGIERLLLGSVAERVTRMAHCPVLILRD